MTSFLKKIIWIWALLAFFFINFIILCFPRKKSNSLLLIRLDSIGDFLIFHPFIKRIKQSKYCKGRRLIFIGNKVWKELIEIYCKDVDEFISLDRKKFLNNIKYRIKFLLKIRRLGAKIVLNPCFSREAVFGDSIVWVSGASLSIGIKGDQINIVPTYHLPFFFEKVTDWMCQRWYSKLIYIPPHLMEFEKHRMFFRSLSISTHSSDILNAKTLPMHLLSSSKVKNNYAVLVPGSGEKYRQWPPDNFAHIGQYVYQKYRLQPVILGSISEQPIANRIMNYNKVVPWLNYSGKTSLLEFIKFLGNAKLIICNETSAFHIAIALKTKVVCILGGGHFGRFAPYPTILNSPHICVYVHMDCFNCNWRCRYTENLDQPYPCIVNINIHQVTEAIDQLQKNHERIKLAN